MKYHSNILNENNDDELFFEEKIYERMCRMCGCTDNDCRKCIEKSGKPFHWVEDDVCSCCADEMEIKDL